MTKTKKVYRVEVSICAKGKWEDCEPGVFATKAEAKAFEKGLDALFYSDALLNAEVITGMTSNIEAVGAVVKPVAKKLCKRKKGDE
jgi:hypothetical protein